MQTAFAPLLLENHPPISSLRMLVIELFFVAARVLRPLLEAPLLELWRKMRMRMPSSFESMDLVAGEEGTVLEEPVLLVW